MISKLIKLMPSRLLVALWNNIPFPRRFKEWVIWRGNSHFLVAVLGIITNDKGQVLLLKHTYRKQAWGIPSGWLEYEEPSLALKREVFEETGFLIEPDQVISTNYDTNPHRINILMTGRYIEGDFQACPEVSDYMFSDLDQLPAEMPDKQKRILSDAVHKGMLDAKKHVDRVS